MLCCRLTDAEGMLGQAWRTMKQCLGHVHPKLAQILADLATLKARQDRSTEAQQLLRRSVAMWRHMGAGSNPALLSALRMLIKLGSNSGKYLTFSIPLKYALVFPVFHTCMHAYADQNRANLLCHVCADCVVCMHAQL